MWAQRWPNVGVLFRIIAHRQSAKVEPISWMPTLITHPRWTNIGPMMEFHIYDVGPTLLPKVLVSRRLAPLLHVGPPSEINGAAWHSGGYMRFRMRIYICIWFFISPTEDLVTESISVWLNVLQGEVLRSSPFRSESRSRSESGNGAIVGGFSNSTWGACPVRLGVIVFYCIRIYQPQKGRKTGPLWFVILTLWCESIFETCFLHDYQEFRWSALPV